MEQEIEKLKITVDDLMQKQNEIQQQIAKMKEQIDESIKFEKKLIEALQTAEDEQDCYLLPQGTFHGIEIK